MPLPLSSIRLHGMPNLSTIFCALLVLSVSGAVITTEEAPKKKLIRKVRKEKGTAGKLVQVHLGPSSEMMVTEFGTHVRQSVVPNECDDVFPFGTEGADGCDGNTSLIEDDGKCEQAAAALNYAYPASAVLTGQWKDVRPRGCFKQGESVFYNDRDDDPPVGSGPIVGTPVCLKKRYMNGTAVPGAVTSCPDGYTAIPDETACRLAGNCQGNCEGSRFNEALNALTSANAKNVFPHGCFVHETEVNDLGKPCVFFNPPDPANPPTAPVGTPICAAVIDASAPPATAPAPPAPA